ncbi:MAG: hypothetical protein ACK5MK_09085 [Dysgonomonas sp.]
MRKIIYILPLLIIAFSCGKSSKNESVKAQQSIKSAKIKTMKVVQFSYKFGKPDPASAKTLLTTEFDNRGNSVKEVSPYNILTYAYKDINKVNKLSDIQELNTQALLQFQTNFEYADNGAITATRFTVDGDVVTKTVMQRDKSDRDTSVVVYDKRGVINSKKINRFDDIGLKESITYNSNDSISNKIVRLSGDKKQRVFIIYNELGVATSVFTENYDSDDNMVEYMNAVEDLSGFRHFKRTYKNGLLQEEIEFQRNGEPKSVIKYTYEK